MSDKETDNKSSTLTPLRAHYLKKSLIQLQFNKELESLTSEPPQNVSSLSYLGPPFSPPPKGLQPMDLPFLRYMFRQFVLTFPFMAAAPNDFYSQKLQPFVDALLARNISSTSVLDDGPSEQVTKKKLIEKAERNFALFIGAATKLVEHEDVVRLTQADLDRIETLSKKRQAKLAKRKDAFEVNIVGVRTVVDKGRMRSRAHEEFLIRTRRSRYPDVVVSRRYGDFRTLAAELTKAHPEKTIRSPPAKDRSYVNVPPSPSSSTSPYSPGPSELSRQPTTSTSFSDVEGRSSQDHNMTPPSRLSREKNRLTLRAYLHSLLSSSVLASSPVIRSFLLSGPIQLSPEELEDARRREEADKVREDSRIKFAKEIANRVDSLRDAVKSVKGDLLGKDGLTQVFGTIKVTESIKDLPPNYHAVVEWARISLASTVFHQFVASDDASESFAGLKRIHGLMPYFMLKAALKISNPISMIRNVLDLFLAQPFGGRSLLQRMFTSSLTEEVRSLEAEIEAVKDKVDDPMMCAKIRQFVYAPREIQAMFKADAASEQMNIITVVLRSAEAPVLSRVQMHRLARAHKAHTIYMKHRESLDNSDDDDGPQDEDAWLLEDLRVLAHLYSKLKDREQLIELIFEGFTAELLKDIITIFYSPLAQVYRAASIADSIGDLQNFVNDLIKTVEHVEEALPANIDDPHVTVQAFINLIQRHEQSFYHFVHKVHSKGEGLFDSLMKWIEQFLTAVREGLGDPISLEFLLPHTGKEREDILAEVDQVATYHYKLKVLYEAKLRRRFGRVQGGSGQSDADVEDEIAQNLVNGVVSEIGFGDLVTGDAIDLAAEETDEESSSEEYTSNEYDSEEETDSSYESGTDSDGHPPPLPHKPTTTTLAHPPLTVPISSSSTSHPKSPSATPRLSNHHPKAHSQSHSPQAPKPGPPTRKRSLSQLITRKLNISSSNLSAKRNQDPPPVPPLPSSSKGHQPIVSKPLPPSPNEVQHSPQMSTPRSQQQSPVSAPPPTLAKKKQPQPALKSPELTHIPQLLPIFVEMMRPSLRVKKV
ncbi:hypothetical protein CVT24_011749 [Panaeolus cyanescens]|uniref:PX domain-containing protein n=1 Tax=Panaeolus cyanescens TaxID=181874 RepID=A0A409VYQ6_9AGAR|nr:hypothetical protein CVT24_011749 [Panaeolus cyanescens]